MANEITTKAVNRSGVAREVPVRSALQRIERFMSFAIMALYASLAAVVGYILIGPISGDSALSDIFGAKIHPSADQGAIRGWLLLAIAPSLTLTLVTAFRTRKLFRMFGRGIILDMRNAALLRAIGNLLLASVPINILTHTLVVLALTSGNPAGQKQLAIHFKSFDITVICFGLFVLAFAHVIGEGARLADENRSFV